MNAEETVRLGRWLHQWHDNQSDPIYAVGSLLVAGKGDQVTPKLYESCYKALDPDVVEALDGHRLDLINLRSRLTCWWIKEYRGREQKPSKFYQIKALDFDQHNQFPLTFFITNYFPSYIGEVFDKLSLYGQPNSVTGRYTSWSFPREYMSAIIMLLIKEGYEVGKLVD